MDLNKKKYETLGPGMELVRGGFIEPPLIYVLIPRCACSPGGWSYGFSSDYRCACGCPGPAGPADNNEANHFIAVPLE